MSERVDSLVNEKDRELWMVFGVDMKVMISNRPKGNHRYFIVALLGKIKGEHQGRYHLLPSVKITSSAIDIFRWVDKIMNAKMRRGQRDGPLFSDWDGKVLSTETLDKCLVELLEELYHDDSSLLPAAVKNRDEIVDHYQVYRSIRRSSDTRAIEQKVADSDIDIVNRWQKVEKAHGSRPNFQMKQHHAEVEILLEPFLRYTFAM